jgi:Ca-activated chloride channel homolog
MKTLMKTYFLLVLLFGCGYLNAQSVRELNNKGVDQYEDGRFVDSEVNFKKGTAEEPKNFETSFNLGDAYYKQQKYDEAIKSFQSALEKSESTEQKAKVYHNIGNSLLKDKKIKESVEAYKNSLKINPNDEETKYNLSYALSLLKNQQNQQQKNKNNKNDKNNKDQKDQNKNQQNKDKDKKNQQDQNQDKNNQNKPEQNQTAKQDNLKPQEKNKISKEEAERILEALKNNEQDLQKKLRKKTGTPIKTDKDW